MNEYFSMGKLLIALGLIIAGIGLVVMFAGKIPWLGRLPGDLHFRGERFEFYFPLATSLLVSVVFSLILWFINRR